jgi:hypothetical protein
MMPKWILLLSPTLAVGALGTRTALQIRRSHGKPQDQLFMLILCWIPFLVGCVALALSLCGSPS